MSLSTHLALPVPSLATVHGLARAGLASLGALPVPLPYAGSVLPDPTWYWPFETDNLDVMTGDDRYPGTPDADGWYGKYLPYAVTTYGGTVQATEVNNLIWYWALVDGVWTFVGKATYALTTLGAGRIGATAYSAGASMPSLNASGIDEVASYAPASPITPEAAAAILAAAYNDGIGVVWRAGQWWEPAE